jgi:hypothetical protein
MSLDEVDRFERSAGTDEPNAKANGSGALKKALILSSGEFVRQFKKPDYLIDGILLRSFLYSFTALTGVGKTAIALLIAHSVALGRPIGEIDVTKGRVLYLVGENPDDLRMRWMAMSEIFSFDDGNIDVFFVAGIFNIADMRTRIAAELTAIGGVSLIIVDTSAAYFDGTEENSNTELGNYARMLRTLVEMPGAPTVLVLCHPVKNATRENLLPRGGGAFLNEVDGNLVAYGDRPLAELHWQGKFRGPDFEPIQFEMILAKSERVKDSKDRIVPTVAARFISSKEQADRTKEKATDQDRLLNTMLEHEGASLAALAEEMDWRLANGDPNKMRVKRLLEPLKGEKLVSIFRGTWTLTPSGKKEVERLKSNKEMAGATY